MVAYTLDIERSEDAQIELTTIILKDFLYIYGKTSIWQICKDNDHAYIYKIQEVMERSDFFHIT